MKLLMYGVSKETVSEEDIDRYHLNADIKKRQIMDIQEFDGVEEVIILTNDFRNEYYLYVDENEFSHGQFLRYIANETEKKLEEVILETYSKFNEDVLRHLYEISSGYLIKPLGSFIGIETLENALVFARENKSKGPILFKLFTEVIRLSYKLKLNDKIQPLNRSKIAEYLFKLKEQMGSFKNKNFIISGNDLEIYYLTKLLLFAQVQSITIIHEDDLCAIEQYNKIKKDLTQADQLKLNYATKKSLCYRLAKSDAIIFDETSINILTNKVLEEVAILRPTRKLQHLIDLNTSIEKIVDSDDLDIQVISVKNEKTYTEEQKNNAIVTFDEEVSNFIHDFMNYLKEINLITTNKN